MTSLQKQRRDCRLSNTKLGVLRLLQRARGPVTEELFRYHLWCRYGAKEPEMIHYYFSHIKYVTGLGIARRGAAGWILVPELDEPWCRQEVWAW